MDKDRCNFAECSEKPNMIVQLTGAHNTIFFVTVPGPAVSSTLEILRKNGIGVSVGRVILTAIDYLKPDLSKPLKQIPGTVDDEADKFPAFSESETNYRGNLQRYFEWR
jgi:hypothetical protein